VLDASSTQQANGIHHGVCKGRLEGGRCQLGTASNRAGLRYFPVYERPCFDLGAKGLSWTGYRTAIEMVKWEKEYGTAPRSAEMTDMYLNKCVTSRRMILVWSASSKTPAESPMQDSTPAIRARILQAATGYNLQAAGRVAQQA